MATDAIRNAARSLVDYLNERDHESYNQFLDDEAWSLVEVLEQHLDAPTTELPPLWSIRCFQCDNNAFHTTLDRSVAIAWLKVHRVNCPGHDVRLISIIRD